MDKPNLVYITADQLKASAAPILGNQLISCPFMERLAEEGITFPETYAASTICTPSRASVFTGVHPLVHQVTCWQNKAPLNLPQMSELFASAGYYTAVSGHFEQGRNLSRGWYEQVDLREPGPLARALETKYSLSGSYSVGANLLSAYSSGNPVGLLLGGAGLLKKADDFGVAVGGCG